MSTPSGVCSCGARRVVRRGRVWEMFRASERDLLLATVPKVGKSTGGSFTSGRAIARAEAGAFTTRLQENFLFVSSKGSSLLLRRCRWPMRRRSLCVCRAAGSACRLIPWFPRRREALGAVRLPIRRTESSAPTEGLLSFYRSLGGPMWASPPTKGLSCHWRSAGGGVRAPSKWLSNPCVSRTLNRRGCRQGRRISGDP